MTQFIKMHFSSFRIIMWNFKNAIKLLGSKNIMGLNWVIKN